MKRNNKLMKASGVLLVLTLITSCFVGGTLAKYVSEGEGKDSARVAKWGVKVDVTGDNAFAKEYGKDDVNVSLGSTPENSVASAGSESVTFTWNSSAGNQTSTTENVSDVIAPGTEGTFGGIKVTGTPEVAVKIETNAEVVFTGWNVDGGKFYCPLVFEIGDETICGLKYSGSTGETNGGQSSFEDEIEKAIEQLTNNPDAGDNTPNCYPANTQLDINKDFNWKWSFSGEDGVDTEEQEYDKEHSNCFNDHKEQQSDELDTLLGKNALSENSTEIPAVYIKVTTTVTQID